VKSIENGLKVFNKRCERSGFLLLFHGFKRIRNQPLLYLIIRDAFEDEGVKSD